MRLTFPLSLGLLICAVSTVYGADSKVDLSKLDGLFAAGRDSEALAILQAGIDDDRLRLYRAGKVRARGNWKLALSDYEYLLAKHPRDDELLLNAADTARQHGQYAKAEVWYKRLLAISKSVDYRKKAAARGIARVYEAQKEYSKAVPFRREQLASTNFRTMTGEEQLDSIELARDLNSTKEYEQALLVVEGLLRRNPRNKSALEEKSRALIAMARYAEAERVLDQAVRGAPDYPAYYLARARVRKALGNSAGAAQDIQKAGALEN